MTEPEDLEEDIFADLYDGDTGNSKDDLPHSQTQLPVRQTSPVINPIQPEIKEEKPAPDDKDDKDSVKLPFRPGSSTTHALPPEIERDDDRAMNWTNGQHNGLDDNSTEQDPPLIGIKEDGKMFIGGLNWETTDLSLKNYFSQFGEVLDCTVMRDGSTGRSRGFGFLTFKDPKTVNSVMVKEHYLDGKIIDPKRAIPRDEQERTSKIFVGGVSQEATEQEFKEFFMQFGRVLDATLMIDKDTGRPRGFGFVTFDSEAAVESALSQPLEIHGKAIEVKKAQPRGNVRDNDEDRSDRRFNRRGRDNHDRFDRDNNHRHSENSDQEQDKGQGSGQTQQAGQGLYAGMTPQMMAQYWQRMQQYFALMTQQMAAAQTQGLANPMAMATGMNPAMLQQLTALQAMSRQSSQGAQSPQSPGAQAMQGMNPAMMQQLQQMQQMQQMQQQQQQQAQVVQQQQANFGAAMPAGGNMGGFNNGGRVGPGYNAYEQQLFEQRKYEQQQARRAARDPQQAYQQPFQGGMTSWEGMYDDVPQPNMGMQQGFQRQMTPNQGQGGGGNRQHSRGSQGLSPAPPSTAPANAPTGPKNAGKPGANYRGGGRGGNRFHPYSRP